MPVSLDVFSPGSPGRSRRRVVPLLMALAAALMAAPAFAQVCAPPASLQPATASGMVNTYYQGSGSLPVGATSLVLGAIDTRGASTALAVGDLMIVMQMQDASFNASNNSTYGDGSGSGQGSTSAGRSGLYEFLRVTSVSGGNIGFTPPLSNSYAQADVSGSTPQKRYQVIRVAQYSALTANGITAPAWNGLVGGVAAVDVRDTLTLGSGTVEGQSGRAFFVAGKGFRGGMGLNFTANGGTQADYATASIYHGSKGEGIAGTPNFVANLTSSWGYQLTNPPAISSVTSTSNYPGGSSARGAPGNAGGGGTDGALTNAAGGNNQYNAGGGGGGNYGPGGIGGRPWNYPLEDTGGRGGAGYLGTLAFNRVILGGGGGAGGTNNNTSDANAYANQGVSCSLGAGACSSGAPGGGIVIIRARSITGSGIIDARGGNGYNVANDAAGGGGAGGGVVIQTQLGGNATVYANGGDGGNAWGQAGADAANRHGPGGGGGGGFVAYAPASLGVFARVDGGVPGISTQLSPPDSYDANGYNGGLTTFLAPNVPGAPPAAQCDPNLSLAKTDGVSALSSPGSTTYSLTVLNSGLGASSGTVAVADKLPAGLSVVSGPLALSGANAASWSCSASTTTDILCTSSGSISGSGGSSTFAFAAAVSAANGSSLVNRAQVSGGGDPNKATPADPVGAAAACTANNTPAGCALDTDTVLAPNLMLTKTDGTSSVVQGGTTAYTLVVSNTGGAATAGTIRVVDVLPTGLVFSGTSPFTANGFTCTVSAPTISCDRASALAGNASATLTFQVTVGAGSFTSVLNLAQVGGGGDPSAAKSALPTAASAAACAAPVPPADTSSDGNTGCAADADQVSYVKLSLSKDDGAPFMSTGGTVSYTFVVRNNGTAASSGAINFRDVLPAPMNFPAALSVGGDNAADWSCTRVSATSATCASSVSIPAGGSSSFVIGVNVGAAASGDQLTNKARVGGGGDALAGMVASPAVADVSACTTDGNPPGCAIDMNTVQSAPQIRLAKSHPNPQSRSPGDGFAFTLRVTNTGGSAAGVGTVQLIDVVPAGLAISSVAPDAGFTCATTGQVVNCRNASSVTGTAGAAGTYSLAAGASRAVLVNVTVATTASNDLLNVAKAAGSTDPQNSTPLTTATTSLAVVSACAGTDTPYYGCATDLVSLNADLQIAKTQRTGTNAFAAALASAVPTGGTVQFALDVTNAGPSRVTAAQVVDTVPTNFTNVSWTCGVSTDGTGTGTSSCGAVTSGSGNAIALTTGLLKTGAVLRITVTAVATYASDTNGVTNTAVVTPPSGIVDGTTSNNSASVNTRVGTANLGITKSNGASNLQAGATTTYTIVVTNTGDFPADGSRLYDPVAAGLSCTAPPTCVATGAATSCPPGLNAAQLQNSTAPTGVLIPTLGPGGTLTFTYTCGVTATGQ